MPDLKPKSAYPSTSAWLGDLDHSECSQDRAGNCRDVHCVHCGECLGGGYVRCRCDGATKAWESSDQRHAAGPRMTAEKTAVPDLTDTHPRAPKGTR